MYIGEAQLDRRYFYSSCYYNCSSSWYSWGRWVLLGVIIAVFVAFIIITRTWSRYRVNHGQRPVMGTAWMLPSYQQSQQQYGDPTAPPYNPNGGHNGAYGGSGQGYYDGNGNYVGYQGNQGNHNVPSEYAPPQGPPPGHPAAAQNGQGDYGYEMGHVGGSNGVTESNVNHEVGSGGKTPGRAATSPGSVPAVPPPAYNGS